MIRRRKVLALCLALWPALRAARGAELSLRQFFGTFSAPGEPVTQFATLYLAQHPQEASQPLLEHLLFGGSGKATVTANKAYLLEKIAADFDSGETVNLDGWMLSRTEVRLWCLFYLIAVEPRS